MFLVLLKFSDNKAQAAKHMAGHNAWIQRGFDEGIFALVGSLKPAGGLRSEPCAPRRLGSPAACRS